MKKIDTSSWPQKTMINVTKEPNDVHKKKKKKKLQEEILE
jgi:hypothetical protein